MREFKNTPINHALLTEKVLHNRIGSIKAFEIEKYGLRDQCNCRLIQVKIETPSANQEPLKMFLSNQSVTSINLDENDELITASFQIRYRRVLRDFQKMYSTNYPHYSEYIDKCQHQPGEIDLIIYKRVDTDYLEYEIVNNKICSFSKDNKNSIEKALFIKRSDIFWEIKGTGCSCSSFEPLGIEEINKEKLIRLFKELQSQINEEEEFIGITKGKYDA